jgi:hypothetical protein
MFAPRCRPLRSALVVAAGALALLAASARPLAAGVDRWTPIGLTGGPVEWLLADPLVAGTAYCATSSDGPFKTVDGGRRWVRIRRGLPAGEVR